MFQTILTCQYGRDNFEEYTENVCVGCGDYTSGVRGKVPRNEEGINHMAYTS